MAATHQAPESDLRHDGAPPPPPDTMLIDSHINGFTRDKDPVSEIPSPPLERDEQPNGFAPSFIQPNHGVDTASSKGDHFSTMSAAAQPEIATGITPGTSALSVDSAPQGIADLVAAPSEQQLFTPPAAVDQPAMQSSLVVPHDSGMVVDVPPATDTTAQISEATSLPATHAPAANQALTSTVNDLIAPQAQETPTVPETNPITETSAALPTASAPIPVASSEIEAAPVAQIPQAAVDSHTESIAPAGASISETVAAPESSIPEPPPAQTASHVISSDHEMQDVQSSSIKVSRERDEDEDTAPGAKRTKTDESLNVEGEFKIPDAPQPQPQPQPQISQAASPTPIPTATGTPTPAESTQGFVPTGPIDSGPLSELQVKKLLEGLRNLKKTKHSQPFQHPVDHVILGLPKYPEIIKNPMDLSTIERKLRDNQYPSVDAYVKDFNLMVENAYTFNGPLHAVTHLGLNMKRQLEVQLRKLPKSHESAPVAAPKAAAKQQSSTPREPKRRESRPSLGAAQSPSSEAFALGPNGVPFIRRESMAADGRPKREIHRPPPRDLPYSSKPKKKKYQIELKFCDHVMEELLRGRYNAIAFPFLNPVDAVGLGLTTYHKIIKKPMDLGTIARNLKAGEYDNAADFEADVKLMFSNCYKFNPPQDGVHQLGKQFEAVFDDIWAGKDEWVTEHTPASERMSPEENESDSDVSSEEDDDEEDTRAAQLNELQKQIALLNEQASALLQGSLAKPKSKDKSKSGKSAKPPAPKKRKSGGGAAPSSKSEKKSKKSAKVRPVTLAQKQEISEKVVLLGNDQQQRALSLITSSLHAAGRHEEARKGAEGEFDIEKIPDATLHDLLKMVRRHVPSAGGDELSHATVERPKSHSSKPKKNKPMSKYEQEDRISALKAKLQGFEKQDSNSDDGDAASSDDESESGSESEEE